MTSDIIIYVLFIIISVAQIWLSIAMFYIRNLVHNNVYNNIYSLLTEIKHQELDKLSTDTAIERALWKYLNTRLEMIYKLYKMIKAAGDQQLADPIFKLEIIGSALVDFQTSEVKFPTEFVDTVESINQRTVTEFIDNYISEMQLSPKSDRLLALKTHTLKSFRKGVARVYNAYENNRHLILDEEYQLTYPQHFQKQYIVTEMKSEVFSLKNVIDFKPHKIKTLVQSGFSGLKQAVDFLIQILPASDITNDLINLRSQISNYDRDKNIGIEPSNVELNRIIKAVLNIIDEL